MAKCLNPLLSLDASGSIGKAITYTSAKGVHIVKKFFKSLDRQSDNQIAVREYFQQGCTEWNNLTPGQKEEYVNRASDLKMTGFNLFMKEYLNWNLPLRLRGLYGPGLYGYSLYWED